MPWLKWLFVAMAIAAMGLALFEFYVLAKRRDLKPDTGAGFLAATTILVVSVFPADLYNIILVQLIIIVLTAGTYGNVVRLLPPLTIDETLLADGLDVLDEAVAEALA